jgi:hypothetical protein
MIANLDLRVSLDKSINKLYMKLRKDKDKRSKEIIYLNKTANIPLKLISEHCEMSIGAVSMYLNKQYPVKPEKILKLKELIDVVVKRIEDDMQTNGDITYYEKCRLEDIIDDGHKILYGRAIRTRQREKKKDMFRQVFLERG